MGKVKDHPAHGGDLVSQRRLRSCSNYDFSKMNANGELGDLRIMGKFNNMLHRKFEDAVGMPPKERQMKRLRIV